MLSTSRASQIHTAFLPLGSLCFGFTQGIVGPTLLDLAENYRVDTIEISEVFTSRSIGMLVASAIASFGKKKRNSELILAAALLVLGLFITLAPVVSELWLAHIAFFATGAAKVFFDVSSYVVLSSLWKNPTLQLQLYQLGFGCGTFVIPFISAPFLSQEDTLDQGKLQHASISRIYLLYAGVGAFCVILGICMITFSYFVALPLESIERPRSAETCSDGTADRKTRFNAFEVTLVFLLCSFIFFDLCLESTYTGLITPFVVESELRMDTAAGAFIGGVFRSTFFAGRILTVIGYRLSLRMIILSSLTFLLLSSIVLSLCVLMSPIVVWVASAGLGLGLSTLFGTGMAWTCQYISLKHWHSALLMVAVCLGSSSPTFIAAPWIESFPMLLMYVMVGLSAILWVIFGCMMLLVQGDRKTSTTV